MRSSKVSPAPAQRWGRWFYRTPKASEPGYTREAQASIRAGLRALGPSLDVCLVRFV